MTHRLKPNTAHADATRGGNRPAGASPSRRIHLSTGLAILCAALPGANPASAHSDATRAPVADGDRLTEVVRFTDLDLASPQGRARLDERITSAVEHVCGKADIRDLKGIAGVQTCRDESTAVAFAARDTVLAAHDRGEHMPALAIARRVDTPAHTR